MKSSPFSIQSHLSNFLVRKVLWCLSTKKNNTWLPVHISLKRALSWTLQEKLHICAHPHIILYILLLRKARGSSCSCVHLQYILTETLVPSALCYNVQLYNYIYLQLRYFYLWVYLSPLTPWAWWASLLKTPIPPSLHLLTNVSWFADKFLQSQSKLTNFGKI